MEIKTKHNIGDDVWCNLFNGVKVKIKPCDSVEKGDIITWKE